LRLARGLSRWITLARGRALLRQIHRLGLHDVGADAELDIVQPGTPLADFYRLSMAALAGPSVAAGLLTHAQAHDLTARPDTRDSPGCGFAHIGAWGKKPLTS